MGRMTGRAVISCACALAAALPSIACGAPDGNAIVDFAVARWKVEAGGDGSLRALVIVASPWSWRDATDRAATLGATLAAAGSPDALGFLASLADHPGAFDCAGPWLGGAREPGGAWLWPDGTPVGEFGFAAGRPAQASALPSALVLAGGETPDGSWFDALRHPDAGTVTRSALLAFGAFEDCDGDELPDALEIAFDPTLDADGDGRLDSCATSPADVNRDGAVDAADLALVLNAWGTGDPASDIDRSGTVDAADLAAVLSDWSG